MTLMRFAGTSRLLALTGLISLCAFTGDIITDSIADLRGDHCVSQSSQPDSQHDKSPCAHCSCKLVRRRCRCAEFKTESPGLLASATLSAIARLTIIHRAILTSLLTTRLVRRETYCANRGSQDRKQDFEIILHNQRSSATIAKASEKRERQSNLRTQRRHSSDDYNNYL